jgi:hypothetical protein
MGIPPRKQTTLAGGMRFRAIERITVTALSEFASAGRAFAGRVGKLYSRADVERAGFERGRTNGLYIVKSFGDLAVAGQRRSASRQARNDVNDVGHYCPSQFVETRAIQHITLSLAKGRLSSCVGVVLARAANSARRPPDGCLTVDRAAGSEVAAA